jgi:hypothetical protein
MDWVKSGPFVDVAPDSIHLRGLLALDIPDNRMFRSWLYENVGLETQTWMEKSKIDEQRIVAYRYTFKNNEDAVMFKLAFSSSLHV